MNSAAPKLGIIAGSGHLPARLIEACRDSGREFFVLALEGAADMNIIAEVPHAVVRLGAAGESLNYLRSAGVKELVMAGGVKRPSVGSLLPDATGAKLIAKLGLKMFSGDDALLKAIVKLLEDEGFRIVGSDALLGGLLAPAGTLTRLAPDARALTDIELGFRVVRALGAVDVGQAAIVEHGMVLGVEAVEGTDALIARCAGLTRETRRAILVKARKPDQENRVDLPTVGVATINNLHEAGMLGVAYEAGGTLLLDREQAVLTADMHGLFMAGLTPGKSGV